MYLRAKNLQFITLIFGLMFSLMLIIPAGGAVIDSVASARPAFADPPPPSPSAGINNNHTDVGEAPLVDFFANPLGAIEKAITGWVNDISNGTVKGAYEVAKNIKKSSMLSQPWDRLLGGSDTGLYNLVQDIARGTVQPVAVTILSFTIMLQLYKISQRIDGTGALPAVKEVVILAVVVAIFIWAVSHAFQICEVLYDIGRYVTANVEAASENLTIPDVQFPESGHNALAGAVVALITSMLVFFISLGTYAVAIGITYMRALSLYIMAAFSPIPMALMGFEETRSWGMSYLRSFAAQGLSGAIMALTIAAYPVVLHACLSDGASGGDMLLVFGKLIAANLMLIALLTRAGTIAKEVLGG